MPALLYGIGAFALFAGLVMIGFGVPINEFSFGNTLIGAGTTAAIGGLIIIGLGAVAGQLRRLAETLALQSTGRFAPTDVETAGAHRPIPAQAAGRAAHSRPDRRPMSTPTARVSRKARVCRSKTGMSPLRPPCAIPMSHRSPWRTMFRFRRAIR